MRRRQLISLTPCVFLVACGGAPPAYPPPPQREFPAESSAAPLTFVLMSNPDADIYIVRDIRDIIEGTGWRWTHQHPELRFQLPQTRGWKLRADFSFPEPNFKSTGPVTVSFFVNNRLLDKVRYTQPGEHRFEKPVPAAWLRTDAPTTTAAEVDPPWVAPNDKARLGFVLYGMGFVQ